MGHCHKGGRKLIRCGFRLTAGRKAIINVLANTDRHLSAEDMYHTLSPRCPRIGLTTIYRTLEILTRTGVVVKFEVGGKRAVYELSEEYGHKVPHHHLVCRACHSVTDYSPAEEGHFIYKTRQALAERYGFRIDGHVIRFYGLCRTCREKG